MPAYGIDDRQELHELADPRVRELADSLVVLTDAENLEPHDGTRSACASSLTGYPKHLFRRIEINTLFLKPGVKLLDEGMHQRAALGKAAGL